MKKTFTTQFLVATALLVGVATTVNAKSWRINVNAAKSPDFESINAAMSSSEVVDGDTLYFDPGFTLGADQTVSKQVTIIGPGYYLNNTPYTSTTLNGKLILTKPYIKVEGMNLAGVVYMNGQFQTLERCKTASIMVGRDNTDSRNAIIRQCYVTGKVLGGGDSNINSSYCLIENCIFYNCDPCVSQLYLPTLHNNYFRGFYVNYATNFITSMKGATITNNIMINVYNSGKNKIFDNVVESIITNNVLSCAEGTYTTIGENYYLDSNDESLVFSLQGTNDQKYQLKADSPAKGYGVNSVDCGPFGGETPYVISGLPSGIPYYTKANIGTKAKDGKIKVTLNIKMQDE